MEFQTLLDSLGDELRAESYSVGLLLHGSFATGSEHSKSDVDLLCVTDADWYSKEIREVEGFEVEIQKIPEEKVRLDLTRRLPTNNNFMLSILCTGKILFDKTGLLKQLKDEALESWEREPPPPTPFEILMGRSFYRHRLQNVQQLVHGEDPLGIAPVMLGLLFHNCVYGYCKTHRKWALKFTHLMRSISEDDPEFYRLCISYLDAASTEERLQWVEKIVDAVMKPVGWGTIAYQTPRVPINLTGQMRDGMLF